MEVFHTEHSKYCEQLWNGENFGPLRGGVSSRHSAPHPHSAAEDSLQGPVAPSLPIPLPDAPRSRSLEDDMESLFGELPDAEFALPGEEGIEEFSASEQVL